MDLLNNLKSAAQAGGLSGGAGSQSLMNAQTVSFQKLHARYHGFTYPEAVVEVDDAPLGKGKKKSKDLMVDCISVELTGGFEASVAKFRIYNVFDSSGAVFTDSAVRGQVGLGGKLSIKLGYLGTVTEVFRGFIAGINYVYEPDGVPYIEVTGMDLKGAMMANCNAIQLKGKYYSDCVAEILRKPNYLPLIERYDVDATPDGGSAASSSSGPDALSIPPVAALPLGAAAKDGRTIEMVDESDYEFVVKAAKKFSYEFFCCTDTVYFRKPKSQTAPILTLRYGQGLFYADIGVSMSGLVSQVETRGADAGKAALISAKTRVKFKVPSAAGSILSQSRKVYIDPTIRSKQDASQRAEALAEQIQYRFGSLSAECVGLPELVPGRFIQIAAVDTAVSDFYITEVSHSFQAQSGFQTKITAKAAKL